MITKPSWLRSWLDNLNWDILVWHVYVGDAIESGIDWAIDHINDALDWGIDAWNKAVDAWNKAVEVYNLLLSRINSEVHKLLDKIDAWWDGLDDWWAGKYTTVKDWVAAKLQPIKDALVSLQRWLTQLDTWWDNFKMETLPNLIDKVTFWDNVRAETDPIKEEQAKQGIIIDSFKLFFNNPIMWLWSEFNAWFWEEK